jgi:hypothetical protein
MSRQIESMRKPDFSSFIRREHRRKQRRCHKRQMRCNYLNVRELRLILVASTAPSLPPSLRLWDRTIPFQETMSLRTALLVSCTSKTYGLVRQPSRYGQARPRYLTRLWRSSPIKEDLGCTTLRQNKMKAVSRFQMVEFQRRAGGASPSQIRAGLSLRTDTIKCGANWRVRLVG